jgi:hypothetical protein
MIPSKVAEKARGVLGIVAARVRSLAWSGPAAKNFGLVAWRHTVRTYRGISWQRVRRAIFLGLAIALGGALLGAMTVVLPPMAPIGVLAPLVLILIWATPELRRVPIKTMTKAFYAVIVAEALIPYYYAIQIPGLPWLGLRRMTVLSLIVIFSVNIAGSAEIRKRIIDTLSANKAIATCFFGYILMCFLSIFSARYPDVALSQGAEFTFNWFVPAFACIIVIRTTDQVRTLLKLLLWLFFVVTAIGVADFVLERNLMIDIIPKPLLARMMEAYPTFAELVNMHPYRNGYYRSSSVFVEPLSFGEYAAIVAPIGAYFMAHGEKYTERVMGALTIIAALTSLFVSGARGGSIAFIASMPLFFVFWVIRYARNNPVGMAGPAGGALAFMATSGLIGAVLGIGRLGAAEDHCESDHGLGHWKFRRSHRLSFSGRQIVRRYVASDSSCRNGRSRTGVLLRHDFRQYLYDDAPLREGQ